MSLGRNSAHGSNSGGTSQQNSVLVDHSKSRASGKTKRSGGYPPGLEILQAWYNRKRGECIAFAGRKPHEWRHLELSMYCPKCGTDSSIEQKFCRSCGMNLLPVSEVLAGEELELHPSTPGQESLIKAASTASTPAAFYRSKMFRWGFVTGWLGLLLVITLGAGGDALSHISPGLGAISNDLAGLAVVPMLLGAGLIAYSYFIAVAHAATGVHSIDELARERHTIGLPSPGISEPVPSVTEPTTYRLDLKEDVRK
jgi:hypothetical protein